MSKISHGLYNLLAQLHGQPFLECYVGENKSLTVLLGEYISQEKNGSKVCRPRSSFSLGTYSADWTIIDQKQNVLLSKFISRSDETLKLKFGKLLQIEVITNKSIDVIFASGYKIIFTNLWVGGDETFHVKLPKNFYVCYEPLQGWRVGASDVPWRGGRAI